MENRYFETSDGIRLHYTVTGNQPDALVVLPGLGQDCASFQGNADVLSADHTVYVLDYRNHGLSEVTEYGNHIEQYAKDMKEMLADAEIHDFSLLAHSMGNAVAWCFMELYGNERIKKYVLEEEAPILLSDPLWTEEESRRYRGVMDWPSFAPAEMRKSPDSNFTGEMIGRIYHDHVNRDWRDAFRFVTMPTLIIMGTKSHYASEELWAYLQESVPGSEFCLLEGGHAVHLDAFDEFNRKAGDFLRNQDVRSEKAGISESDREMKNKYAVDEGYNAAGKTVLIIGAGGNWGAHLAIGMALTSQCNLILIDSEENRKGMEQVLNDLKTSGAKGSVCSALVSSELMNLETDLLSFVQKEFGGYDSLMNVAAINA